MGFAQFPTLSSEKTGYLNLCKTHLKVTTMTYQPTEMETRLIKKAMEDEAFKCELISNPKTAIEKELGQKWPEAVDIEVLEQTPNKIYLLLPLDRNAIAPQGELSEEQLEAVAGGIFPLIPVVAAGSAVAGYIAGTSAD